MMDLREKIAKQYREFRSFQDGYIPHMVESEAFADWFLELEPIASALKMYEEEQRHLPEGEGT